MLWEGEQLGGLLGQMDYFLKVVHTMSEWPIHENSFNICIRGCTHLGISITKENMYRILHGWQRASQKVLPLALLQEHRLHKNKNQYEIINKMAS